MNLWRKTRSEVAGAWRSVRYDLGRRPAPPAPPATEPADVTSTGMSTFGGMTGVHPDTGDRWSPDAAGYDQSGYDLPGYEPDDEGAGRPRRRLVAAGAFVTLAVVGAAGSYLAVVGGLGGLLRDQPAPAGERPLAAAGRDGGTTTGAGATSGLGRGSVIGPDRTATQPVPPSRATLPPAAGPAPARPAQRPARPVRPGKPTHEGCDCLTPPVPTPTAPPSSTPSPSASTSPSPSPSASGSPASPGPSAEPSGFGSPEAGRRYRRS